MSKQKADNGDQLKPVSQSAVAATEPQRLAPLNEQDIAELAFRRWVDRGCPQGSPEEDWLQAELELLSRRRG